MKWLVLDCSYLCHRAFHTTGHLSFEDAKTGVVFGFLRDVSSFCEYHNTNNVAFCFDSKESKRRDIYPPYKQARRQKHEQMGEEEIAIWREVRRQIRNLRVSHLPGIGFRNIFTQRGYEADDLIASFCAETLKPPAEAVIIASDHDLYQLLSPTVSMWDPTKKKFFTYRDFVVKFGIQPSQWADVKAYAGCSSDGVQGIAGVGEKTAVSYLLGQLKTTSVAYRKIREGVALHTRNLPLVRLPFEGVNPLLPVDDEVTPDKWQDVCADLGIRHTENLMIRPDSRRLGIRPENKRKGFGVV